MRPCPVCSTSDKVVTLLYNTPTGQEIVACRCGMVYAVGGTVVDYAKDSIYACAETYAAQEEHYKWIVRNCYSSHHASIADVGCALGGLLQAFEKAGCKDVTGFSLSVGEVDHCIGKGLKAEVMVVWSHPKRQYNLVTLSHVLEHVPDVQVFLYELKRWLLPEGHLYIEVPNAEMYAGRFKAIGQGFNAEHINHFSLDYLKQACSNAGLRVFDSGMYDVGEYPVIWVRCALDKRDLRLKTAITIYASELQSQMDRIGRRLERELDGVDALAVWGMGQTMEMLRSMGVFKIKAAWICDTNPVHGCLPQDFHPPEDVPILVCSQLAKDSIVASIRNLGLKNRIITLES